MNVSCNNCKYYQTCTMIGEYPLDITPRCNSKSNKYTAISFENSKTILLLAPDEKNKDGMCIHFEPHWRYSVMRFFNKYMKN